jgi:hypothetical protein
MAVVSSVAKDRRALEPEGRCTDAEARELLQRLCPLLEALGERTKPPHPNLMKENAIDSIGRILNEANPEPYRLGLLQAESRLKVYLRRRTHEVLFVPASEKLPYAQRAQCVPIRRSNEVARRLGPLERGMAELFVDFGDNATLLVKQQTRPGAMLVLCTSVAKKKKVLSATLDEAGGVALEKLFDGAGRSARAAPPAEPLGAKRIEYKGTVYWTLPFWYAEIMAAVAQDVFRLHVFASSSSPASAPPVSRMLFVDQVTAHRMDGPEVDRDEVRTVIKAIWHKASGGCLCHLHNRTSPAPFKRIEFRLEVCGTPLVDGKCERHCAEGATCLTSANFPGCCAKAFKAELWCMHDYVQGQPPCGLRVPLASLFQGTSTDALALRGLLVDLACCGVRLAQEPSVVYLKDIKGDALIVLAQLARLRKESNHTADDLENRDQAAVCLLRRGGVNLGPDGKLKGVGLKPEYQNLVPTHGHLFRKTTVR